MGQIYSYDGVIPVVHKDAYVHPSAILIGDVIIGPNVYVGPAASLRGDFGRIIMEEGSNIQDTCVVHAFPAYEVIIEKNGHIGHGAVLHGCIIKENALVGMNAVVMDGAEVGKNSIVSAMAFVKANMKIPDNSLAVGSPAKVLRELSEKEIDWKTEGTGVYQQLALNCKTMMHPVEPLSEVEPNRRKVNAPDCAPLYDVKKQLEPK